MNDAVVLTAVSKHYAGTERATIDTFSLCVAAGEFVVLLGPSGCGKSTILRLIAGLVTPSAGQISIAGSDVTNASPKDRNVAMVFQNYALFPHLSVYDNLAFGMRVRGTPRAQIDAAVRSAAASTGLVELLQKKPRELSGGQSQRVALGRALVRDPAVFLFDEPLSNLDPDLRGRMRTEIAEFHKRTRGAMIYVTHDQLEAMTLADRIVVLRDGAVQQAGAPLDLYNEPANRFVAGFLGATPMNVFSFDDYVATFGDVLRGAAHGIAVGARDDDTLGIRPEDFYLADRVPHDVDATSRFDATIDLFEPLGDGAIVHVSIGTTPFVVRLRHQYRARAGDRMALALDGRRIHRFDANGVRRSLHL